MKIKLNNKILIIKEANSFAKRLFGLIGQKQINYGLLFKNCNSIHTFLMKEAIDIVALDQDNKIIYLKNNLLPNKILRIKNKQKKTSILELPKNTSLTLKLNDYLFFE